MQRGFRGREGMEADGNDINIIHSCLGGLVEKGSWGGI